MSAAPSRDQRAIDIDGLTPAEVETVRGFVAYVRSPEGKREFARAEFGRFWDTWKQRAPKLSDEEAEPLVEEAIAFARGRG